MLRVTRGWLFVALVGLLLGRAEADGPGFTNMLWNPSFEIGTSTPDGWAGFGFGERRWEFHGRNDSRCLSITADGRNAGWWYASRMPRIEHNALYRLSFWARSRADASEVPVVVGLNICSEQILVGPEWQRYEVFFRAPNYLPDVKVCFGHEALKGSVLFDDVALEPAVGIHRSRGRGAGLSLGAGESIAKGRYTAVHDVAGCSMSDRRFLDSYTASYHCGRWVLDGYDEVVYHHTLSRLGIGLLDNTLVVSDRMKYLSGSIGIHESTATSAWVQNDPRAERGLLQRPLRVVVDVPRLEGSLSVDVCQDGRTWLIAGVIERPGVSTIELPPVIGRAYDVWVRIKSLGDRPCEVTSYRYEGLAEGDNRTTAEGASYYLAVLYAPSDMDLGIDDVGELLTGGRHEVKLVVDNGNERRKLGCRVIVEQEGEEAAASEEQTEWMAPHTKHRLHLPYTVQGPGPHTFRVIGREADSGKLLFSLALRTPAEAGEAGPSDGQSGAEKAPKEPPSEGDGEAGAKPD